MYRFWYKKAAHQVRRAAFDTIHTNDELVDDGNADNSVDNDGNKGDSDDKVDDNSAAHTDDNNPGQSVVGVESPVVALSYSYSSLLPFRIDSSYSKFGKKGTSPYKMGVRERPDKRFWLCAFSCFYVGAFYSFRD
jgi:hypothetical protein